MGGFVLVHKGGGTDADDLCRTALGTFAEMGLTSPLSFEGRTYAFHYLPKTIDRRTQFVRRERDGFLACAGTLVYRGQAGAAALDRLAGAADLAAEILRCRGHFALIEGGPDGVRILRDPCAALEVFHDRGNRLFSTSFLAVARAMPHRALRRQEALEFLFHGHTLGPTTLIDGVRRLDIGEEVHVAEECRIRRSGPPRVPPPAAGTREDLARGAVERLTEAMEDVCAAFAGRATLALSGGYDTRLVLGLCRRIDVTPELFVYGSPSSSDVVLGRLIAAREGLELQHIDKDRLCPDIEEADYRRTIRRNFLDADGFVHGGIFGPPTEAIARALRHRDGAVALHGGGGESFRNFFGIAGGPTSTRAIASLFFRIPSGIVPRRFSDRAYTARIAAKMEAALGLENARLSRHMAEALYPHFRYRFWIARELGASTRAGYSYLPLYDAGSVDSALAMPTRFKDHGNLEAEMIRIADPALARHMSNYGHGFEADAPFRRVVRDRILQLRPAWLRRRMYRRGAKRLPPARAWHEDWSDGLLDLQAPLIRELVDPASLRQSEAFENACNLSYLIRDLAVGDMVEDGPVAGQD